MRTHACASVILFLIVAPCASVLGQERDRIQELKHLGLREISGQIHTYYSEGFEDRARDLQHTLQAEVAFFHQMLQVDVSTQLAVLNRDHWGETSGTLPYGILYVSENPAIVFLPAESGGPVSDDFRKLRPPGTNPWWIEEAGLSFNQAAGRMVDLIAFHEIGHVVHRALEVGDSNSWFKEFFATYLSYCFLRQERPEMAGIWNGMMQLKAQSPRPTHTTLADFEALVFGVGLENYIWYEAQFQVRAHEVYEAVGLDFIDLVSSAYPKDEGSIKPRELLDRLEETVPGFLRWAEAFRSMPAPPGGQIGDEPSEIFNVGVGA